MIAAQRHAGTACRRMFSAACSSHFLPPQGDRPRHRPGPGALGLYGFVKQSGGHVNVYSEEERGTTVKLYLPRFTGDAPSDDDSDGSGAENRNGSGGVGAGGRGWTTGVRAYSVETLRELGYRVLEAADGPRPCAFWNDRTFRSTCCSPMSSCPACRGKELSDAARVPRPGLNVLYTSGYTRNAIVHGGRLDPGVALLQKPFTFRELSERVRDLLEAGTGKGC